MENNKPIEIEITLKLNESSLKELKKSINFIFSDLISPKTIIEAEDGNENTNKATDPNNSEITDKQMKYIHALAKDKDLDKGALQKYSLSMFGKDSSKDLTKHQASQFIAALNDLEYNVLDHLKV